MVRSNPIVNDPRLDHNPALGWPEEHIVAAYSSPSGRDRLLRADGHSVRPMSVKYLHGVCPRPGVQIPGKDARLFGIRKQHLVEMPGLKQTILRYATVS